MSEEVSKNNADDDLELLSELKTKKKKKKSEIVEKEADEPSAKGEDLELLSELKTKKKKKKTASAVDQLTDDIEGLNLTKKKKKAAPATEEVAATGFIDQSKVADAAGYTYDRLLERVFCELRVNNPELISDQKTLLTMAPPELARFGSRKTIFVNFAAACRSFNRESSHLASYMFAELGTTGSIDGNGALLIRGRYQNKHIEPVLLNYCRTYVKCGTCQSPKTKLCKDSRLLFVQCLQCHSKITVKNVTSGFQAVTGKRAALRAKAQ